MRNDDGEIETNTGGGGPVLGMRRGAAAHGPRLRSIPDWWKDPALALVSTFLVVSEWASGSRTPLSAVGMGAAAAGSLALFWRLRIGGERLLAIGIVTGLVAVVLGAPDSGLTTLAALYTIGTVKSWRYTAWACALTIVATGLNSAIRGGFHVDVAKASAEFVGIAAITIIPAAIGLYLGARRAYVQALIERAEDLERERELLERERELLAREAVSVERARIARELHDVVAHHVSVMVIQAGAAEAQLPADAGASAGAIAAIRETGREALTEMRRLLGLLRDEERGAGPGAGNGQSPASGLEARTPQPGLADLPVLVARMREAGVDVALEYSGIERPLPPAIDLSAFRVAQEALTNTLRHAGAESHARLRVVFDPAGVTIEALDDGPARPVLDRVEPAGARTGHGLVGMRERVALFDGTFEAGTRRGGGFRVEARFPLEPLTGEAATPDERPRDGEASLPGRRTRTITADESAAERAGRAAEPATGDSEAGTPASGGRAPEAAGEAEAGGSFGRSFGRAGEFDRSNRTEGEA